MKIVSSRVDAIVRQPPREVRAFLLHGPDAGLVRERAESLSGHLVDDLADPFRVAEIGPATLRDDPRRLAAEAATLSLTGGRRLIRVRPAGDRESSAFKSYFADKAADAVVVAEAGELPTRSTLRRLFEADRTAAALPCYPDDPGRLGAVIDETLARHGLTAEPAARAYLQSVLGADRGLTRGELEKLALYMGPGKRVGESDAMACVDDAAAVTLDAIAIAAADGELAELDRALQRALGRGTAPTSVLRALARHLEKLHRLAGSIASGQTSDQALRAFRPPLHFRARDALARQHRHWPPKRTARALEIVIAAEIACKATGAPVESLCGRALIRIARSVKKDPAPVRR